MTPILWLSTPLPSKLSKWQLDSGLLFLLTDKHSELFFLGGSNVTEIITVTKKTHDLTWMGVRLLHLKLHLHFRDMLCSPSRVTTSWYGDDSSLADARHQRSISTLYNVPFDAWADDRHRVDQLRPHLKSCHTLCARILQASYDRFTFVDFLSLHLPYYFRDHVIKAQSFRLFSTLPTLSTAIQIVDTMTFA